MRTARPVTPILRLLFGIPSSSLLALERQPNAIYQARREALAHALHGGVRIEDTFCVDKNGKLQDLIADLPHTAKDIEALMQRAKQAGSAAPATH
jgi:hypothetical protein